MVYPSETFKQPCIPVWIPAIYGREQSIQRAFECDGVIIEKRGSDGNPKEITSREIHVLKSFVDANRSPVTPFDIGVEGKLTDLDAKHRKEK